MGILVKCPVLSVHGPGPVLTQEVLHYLLSPFISLHLLFLFFHRKSSLLNCCGCLQEVNSVYMNCAASNFIHLEMLPVNRLFRENKHRCSYIQWQINLKIQLVFIENWFQYFCRPICKSKIEIIFSVHDIMIGRNSCCVCFSATARVWLIS